jgi:hypothetical protein
VLATEATLGTTRLVEAVHAAVWALVVPGASGRPSRTAGLTGWIYRAVRGLTRLSGRSAAGALRAVGALAAAPPPSDSAARLRLLSVLNGVVGDYLAASDSPLALPFSFHTPDGRPFDPDAPLPAGTDTLAVFVHGLCLSDHDWFPSAGRRTGLVEAVSAAVDGPAVLARYNTGRPIRENGRMLAEHLASWVDRPTGPSRLVLVTHSMGGLVARSAVRHARRTGACWPALVTETIYLGTPHRGAPLERSGAWIEEQLRRAPVTAPFAGLADLRSQGIQDLREGALRPPEASRPASSTPRTAPDLAPGRALYVAAALTADRRARDTIGDGLVPVASALDRPPSAASFSPAPPQTTRRVVEGCGHLALLRDPAVTAQVRRWLSTPTEG